MPNKLTDKEIVKAWDILAKFDFFGGQRAGRELWNEKPVDVQNEDIKNFSKDVEFLKDIINRLQAENERLKEQRERLIRFKKYFENLYGQSLEVANWHLNGVLEPLDNFIDSAMFEMGEEK